MNRSRADPDLLCKRRDEELTGIIVFQMDDNLIAGSEAFLSEIGVETERIVVNLKDNNSS